MQSGEPSRPAWKFTFSVEGSISSQLGSATEHLCLPKAQIELCIKFCVRPHGCAAKDELKLRMSCSLDSILPNPAQVKITMVVGKPIEVPKREQPAAEEVQKYLDAFREELAALFQRHKAAAGYPDLQLLII